MRVFRACKSIQAACKSVQAACKSIQAASIGNRHDTATSSDLETVTVLAYSVDTQYKTIAMVQR